MHLKAQQTHFLLSLLYAARMSLSEAERSTKESGCSLVKDCIERHCARLELTLKGLVQVRRIYEDSQKEKGR